MHGFEISLLHLLSFGSTPGMPEGYEGEESTEAIRRFVTANSGLYRYGILLSLLLEKLLITRLNSGTNRV